MTTLDCPDSKFSAVIQDLVKTVDSSGRNTREGELISLDEE